MSCIIFRKKNYAIAQKNCKVQRKQTKLHTALIAICMIISHPIVRTNDPKQEGFGFRGYLLFLALLVVFDSGTIWDGTFRSVFGSALCVVREPEDGAMARREYSFRSGTAGSRKNERTEPFHFDSVSCRELRRSSGGVGGARTGAGQSSGGAGLESGRC
jgi:hypothetical protein